MSFLGTVPINLSFNAVQTMSVDNVGVFCISEDMRLKLFNRPRKLPSLSIDMGDDIEDKDVYEFTVCNIGSTTDVIVRNSKNLARKITIYDSAKSPKHDSTITNNVIKVIDGRMIIGTNNYAVSNKSYIQLGKYFQKHGRRSNNTYSDDFLDYLHAGQRLIELDESSSQILEVCRGAILKTNGDLYYNGVVVSSDVISVGFIPSHLVKGLLLGKLGNVDNNIRNEAHKALKKAKVLDEWHEAYEDFMDKASHPSCAWVGYGETHTHTVDLPDSSCVKLSNQKSVGGDIVFSKDTADGIKFYGLRTDGKTYEINDYFPDGKAFNEMYVSNSHNAVLINHLSGGSHERQFYFEQQENKNIPMSKMILKR